MNNESKIIDKIIADAHLKAEEIIAQAQAEVDTKVKEVEQKAKKETEIVMEAAKIEATRAIAKEISSAQMLSKKKILGIKQELIEQTIKKAKDQLLSLSDAEKEETILSMLKKAVTNNNIEIILSPKDNLKLTHSLRAAGYKVSETVRDISGGFILKDGDIEYNYSFEAIIAVQHEELEQLSAKILFS